MNTARKAMDCLICFSIVNLMNLLPCQKQLECHQHILNKIRFVKIICIYPLKFVKTHEILARTGAKGEPVTTPSI